ncbi:hypothetical protein QJS10_CPA02g00840 [Acorus calamus]|uniref:Cytochrome c oxidase copper chaperone n=1 Tax=Acorus calamus TaxID=4465 RepID=A0AAV9FD61_ACOCL|nr:hypothetical protein QJS10_CPA02g00840 [Acorus calamus]
MSDVDGSLWKELSVMSAAVAGAFGYRPKADNSTTSPVIEQKLISQTNVEKSTEPEQKGTNQSPGIEKAQTSEPSQKPKKKICCACPDTKKLRDECIVEHGEEACSKWIEAHLQCLRAEGFKV